MSNIRPRGKNQPTKHSNPAHWTPLENVKNRIDFFPPEIVISYNLCTKSYVGRFLTVTTAPFL